MKIDVYPHILPPKYKEAISKKLPAAAYKPFQLMAEPFPTLTDLDNRFRIMDKHQDLVQILTITLPFVEALAKSEDVIDLVKLGNDEMAELVEKYPDRFVAAIGNLPLNDIDASLVEMDRIINELHFRGIQIGTSSSGKPLDEPEFMPIYEKMEQYNLPILLHPTRPPTQADYPTKDSSQYEIYSVFGWPYETSAAMTHLVFGHVLQKYPDIKILTHHCGGMIPYFEKRILNFHYHREMRGKNRYNYTRGLNKAISEYFKMFYADTALNGCTAGLMCGYAFFGVDHIIFGTDMPYDVQDGHLSVGDTIKSVECMQIPDFDKQKIFEDNARKFFRLPT